MTIRDYREDYVPFYMAEAFYNAAKKENSSITPTSVFSEESYERWAKVASQKWRDKKLRLLTYTELKQWIDKGSFIDNFPKGTTQCESPAAFNLFCRRLRDASIAFSSDTSRLIVVTNV